VHPIDIIKVSHNLYFINEAYTLDSTRSPIMKSVNQLLESATHKNIRMKVCSCTQHSVIENIIDQEMQSFLSDILNDKLKEEQRLLLQREPHQPSGDRKKQGGYRLFWLKGLFHKLFIKKAA
jgi:hypothetical protein